MHAIHRLIVGIFLSSFFFLLSPPVFSQSPIVEEERIVQFEADITVKNTGVVQVKETIEVYAAGNEIRRGIYRDFPLLHGFLWQKEKGFRVIQVLRDGKPEQYHTENVNDGIRIYFGKEDVFLSPGMYSYTFIYETTDQLGYFKTYDELYWNVTGNNWNFPIEKTRFRVMSPEGSRTETVQAKAFIGPQGSTEELTNIQQEQTASGVSITGETNRVLLSGEGVTLAINWPKTLVKAPFTFGNKWLDALITPQSLSGLLVFISILIAYTVIWWKEGRDRTTAHPVVVSYEPPEDVSPAMARYINSMGILDDITYTTIVLHLAIKGYLKIHKDDQTYMMYRTAKEPHSLSEDERIVYETFFGTAPYPDPVPLPSPDIKEGLVEKIKEMFMAPEQPPGVFAIHRTNQVALRSMQSSLDSYFNKEKKNYIVPNQMYLIGGIVALLAYVAFNYVYHSFQWHNTKMFFLLFSTIWVGVVSIFVHQAIVAWRELLRNGRGWGKVIFLTLFLTPFVIVGGGTALVAYSLGGAITLFASTFALSIFSIILSRHTPAGLAIQDKIDGFLLFVKSQERYIKKVHKSIPEKFSMYERYLPYAIALDVEPQWSEDFKETIEKMQMDKNSSGTMHSWYSGSSLAGGFGTNSFASSFSSSFSSSMSSGSSSGSSGGGGGSSGGGGW